VRRFSARRRSDGQGADASPVGPQAAERVVGVGVLVTRGRRHPLILMCSSSLRFARAWCVLNRGVPEVVGSHFNQKTVCAVIACARGRARCFEVVVGRRSIRPQPGTGAFWWG